VLINFGADVNILVQRNWAMLSSHKWFL